MKARNILVFEKIVNGKSVKREIRCAKDENAVHIKAQALGGWKLIKMIG